MTATEELLQLEDLDVDIIKDKPWALEILRRGENLFRKIFLNAFQQIEDIDSTEEVCKQQVETFSCCIESKMKDTMSHVNALYQHHTDRIGSLINMIADLEKKLGVTPSVTDKQYFGSKTLLELEKSLETTVEEYKKMLDERHKLLEKLNDEHAFFAYKLGKSPKRLSPTHSKTSLEEFQSQITKLKKEFSNRQDRYEAVKGKIEEINRETQIAPTQWTEFCNDSIKVNDEIMDKIEKFYKEAICLRADLQEEIDNLNRELERLWNLLEIPPEEQKRFVDTLEGYSKATQKKIQLELEKLSKIKESKLPEILEKQKAQIRQLWDSCHCDQYTRCAFLFIDRKEYSEELYNKYNEEINKWEQYYEKHREILEQLNEHKKLINTFLDMDMSMRGVKFYENRGGVLLRTMKQRKILTSRIATSENKLLASSLDYLRTNNRPFLTFGRTIEHFLDKMRRIQKSSQNPRQDDAKLTPPTKSQPKLTPPTKSQPVMRTPQSRPNKQLLKKPSPVKPRHNKNGIKTRTPPTLPKFKLNQNKTKDSPSSLVWKPSKAKVAVSKKSDGEDSWTDYSDFEEELKYSPRSTSFGLKTKN